MPGNWPCPFLPAHSVKPVSLELLQKGSEVRLEVCLQLFFLRDLDKLIHLAESQFLHLYNGGNSTASYRA